MTTPIPSPWRAPLLWSLTTQDGPLPLDSSGFRVGSALRGALLDALGDDGWLIAEDREGRPAGVLTIPHRGRTIAVGVALRATVAADAELIVRKACNGLAPGRNLKLATPITMPRLVGPSASWSSLTPWIADASLSRGGSGRGARRTPDQLAAESLGRMLDPTLSRADARDYGASLIERVSVRPDAKHTSVDARDWDRPRSSYPPYTAFVRLALRQPLYGPLLIGRGHYQGCGLMVADDA